jgi:hypothetical protein
MFSLRAQFQIFEGLAPRFLPAVPNIKPGINGKEVQVR